MGQCFCCTTVGQSEVAVLETCGRFNTIAGPGCHCVLPWTYKAGTLSMRLREHHFMIRSKTKDNVFVTLKLTINVQVVPDRVDAAFYGLEEPLSIIQSYVENSVEAKIPLYNLEALFIERGTISQQLKNETDAIMEVYGWDIVSALITEIDPGDEMTEAINSIQKYQRLRVAAVDEAETKKMQRVRAAEALCESRRLAGQGLAEQRKAIVAGLRKSVEVMRHDANGLNNEDVLNLLLINQYYDTMKSVAENSGGSLLIIDGAGGLDAMAKGLRKGASNAMH
ncbi:hypersensitive-induced response protein 1-like [Trypanosoma grayi]|uniref:hypersensitive-induced response protein 1-like n=1 Tax=Trypanosoma grayi TaxID=71804 RepID=UPI0004F4AB23|nr:hypersensitive-induced response protein 1-like [Trypanosoma grayi]KEG07108.1 hypersensitive-induced response protein 1-like [Trypanosoma grayi]